MFCWQRYSPSSLQVEGALSTFSFWSIFYLHHMYMIQGPQFFFPFGLEFPFRLFLCFFALASHHFDLHHRPHLDKLCLQRLSSTQLHHKSLTIPVHLAFFCNVYCKISTSTQKWCERHAAGTRLPAYLKTCAHEHLCVLPLKMASKHDDHCRFVCPRKQINSILSSPCLSFYQKQ